jgi:hypothetical protein
MPTLEGGGPAAEAVFVLAGLCASAIPEQLPAARMEATLKTATKNSIEEVFLKRLHTSTRLDAVAEYVRCSPILEKKQMLEGFSKSGAISIARIVTRSPYAVLSPYLSLSVRL